MYYRNQRFLVFQEDIVHQINLIRIIGVWIGAVVRAEVEDKGRREGGIKT